MLELGGKVWMGFLFSFQLCAISRIPDNGTGYRNNKMTCSDGRIAYCSTNEECYASEQFGQVNCMIATEYQVFLRFDWMIGISLSDNIAHFRLLQVIEEDKMNAVEALLKNGENTRPKSSPNAKSMEHDLSLIHI